MANSLHIGIVANTAEGAALCYQTICAEGSALLGPYAHPEVSLHNASFAEYVDCLNRDDLDGFAGILLASAKKLEAAGADFLICPANTAHLVYSLVEPVSPLPWLHIAEVVASVAVERGYKKLGITGTEWLVSSDIYPEKLAEKGLEFVRPELGDRKRMGQLILDELVHGTFKPATVAWFQEVIGAMKASGCDAVILGCTEIPLIINDQNSPIPTLDSTRLLARAALRRAIE